MKVTEKLALLAQETTYGALPEPVIASAKLRFLDTIAVMLAGSRHPSTLISLDVCRHMGGSPAATVVGHSDITSSPLAAFVNGVSAHAFEFDDYTKAATHMTVCIVPGCLAIAEELGASGRRLIEGFVTGFEVEARIARGMTPYIFDHGWHPNGVLGSMGVAVAASKILGLDLKDTRMAMGIAASESSGVRKNVGSMGKAFHVGHGARCGVFAALLAKHGFQVDPNIIEGNKGEGHDRFGLVDTFNGIGNYHLNKMIHALGKEWELAQNRTIVRLHPCSTGPQAAIDAMIDLAKKHDIKADQVKRIELETTRQCMTIACYPKAENSHRAKFCLPYMMAVSLIDRKAGIAQFADRRVKQDDVQDLMKRVKVSVPEDFERHRGRWGDGGVNWGEARLAVYLRDGQLLRTSRSYARGWSEEPATWEDLAEKYTECAEDVLTPSRIEETINMIRELPQLPNVRELMTALRAG
ncbi:MAG: MmgE/PrpD family protein [Candidatus Hodarchaeales archaeon]|jgi:2-methylcitrate dehydratase PrpD